MTRQRTASPRGRGRVVRRWLVLLGMLAATLTLAPSAGAQPDFMDCSPPISVDFPGRSLAAEVDPAPMGSGTPGSVYDSHGWSGQIWHPYNISGPCAVSYPGAQVENWLGNQLLAGARLLTALANSLHAAMLDHNIVFAPLDDLVASMSVTLYDWVFARYVGFGLVLSSIAMLIAALRGQLAAIGTRALWGLAGLAVATLTYLMPMSYVAVSDSVIATEAVDVESRIVEMATDDASPTALPTMLHEETVHRPWLMGAFGSDTSPEAQKFGRPLLEAQGCSKLEVHENRCNAKAHQDAYDNLAGQITQTPAESAFSGKSNRVGPGLLALARAISFDLFPIAGKASVLLVLLIVRMLIMAGPVIGAVAIVATRTLPTVTRAVGGAILNAVLLVFAAGLHLSILSWVLSTDLSPWWQTLLMALVSWLLWRSLNPWERLRSMVASSTGVQMPSRQEAMMGRYLRHEQRRRMWRGLRRVGRWFGNGTKQQGGGMLGRLRNMPEMDPDWPPERGQRPETRMWVWSHRLGPPGGGGGAAGGPLPMPRGPRGPQPLSGGGAAVPLPAAPLRGGGGGQPPRALPSPTSPLPLGPVPPARRAAPVFRPASPVSLRHQHHRRAPVQAGPRAGALAVHVGRGEGVHQIWRPTPDGPRPDAVLPKPSATTVQPVSPTSQRSAQRGTPASPARGRALPAARHTPHRSRRRDTPPRPQQWPEPPNPPRPEPPRR